MDEEITNNNNAWLKKPSHRVAKVNENIKRLFGEILQEEADLPADVLVTITGVEASRNLRSAKVWISIWPTQKAKQVMKKMKVQMYHLQGLLNKALHMHPLPRIKLIIDHGAEHADKIQRKLAELD